MIELVKPTSEATKLKDFINQLCFAFLAVLSDINPNQLRTKTGNETINFIPSEKQESGLNKCFLINLSELCNVPK